MANITETRRCSLCQLDKSHTEYYKDTTHSTGYSRRCKSCDKVKRRTYYHANIDACKASHLQWRTANPIKYKNGMRDSRRKTRYGLDRSDYLNMVTEQNGQCAICGTSISGHGRTDELLVDHDHATGKIRGLLCHGCNGGLGHFRDDVHALRAAIRYLEERS